MTPTEFDFTVTMPGDARLVGAIRQLTAQAAGYAQLSAESGEQFAGHVEQAAATVIAAAKRQVPQFEFRFTADPEWLLVVFWCETASPPPRASHAEGGISVDWSTEGSRHVCRIRQRMASAAS